MRHDINGQGINCNSGDATTCTDNQAKNMFFVKKYFFKKVSLHQFVSPTTGAAIPTLSYIQRAGGHVSAAQGASACLSKDSAVVTACFSEERSIFQTILF